ncbi:capsule assembly Wzi family protein [Thermovibrio sp.]
MRQKFLVFLVLFPLSSFASPLNSPSSTVPLVQYQREYELLERAKEIGLIKDVDLSFKPLTREQFAKAIIEIYNNRKLAPKLAKKFFNELYPTFKESVSELLKGYSENYIKPVNNVYVNFSSLSGISSYKLPYSEGYTLKRGGNVRTNVSGELKVGRFLFYLEPEYRSDSLFRLNRAYLTWKLGGVNFLFGRDSVWWGNAENGDLLFTDNVRPWLMFKVENSSYERLPWIFQKLGEWKFSTLFSQLEKERPRSYAHVWGMRLAWRPIKNLEIAGTRAIQFGGKGRPNYNSLYDFWELFTAQNENVRNPNPSAHKYDNNQLASIDITYYLTFLNSWTFQPFKGGKLYFVYAGDDAVKRVGPGGLPLPTGAAHIAGISLTTGLSDFKFEYTETADGREGARWYSHHMYPAGYTYHGFIIGNNIGGDSRSYYFSFSRDFEFANLGVSYNYIKHGIYTKEREERENLYTLRLNKKLNLNKVSFLRVYSARLYLRATYDRIKNFNYQEGDKSLYLLSLGFNIQF